MIRALLARSGRAQGTRLRIHALLACLLCIAAFDEVGACGITGCRASRISSGGNQELAHDMTDITLEATLSNHETDSLTERVATYNSCFEESPRRV